MAVRVKQSHFQAEDLLRKDAPEKFVEIVHGELIVSEPPGWYHNKLALTLLLQFNEFCKSRESLEFCGDNEGFLLRRSPDLLYSPDAAMFYKRPKPPKNQPWREFCPELLIEVISPSNSKTELVHKCQDYFDAGAEQVWLVDPDRQIVTIHFRDGRRMAYDSSDIIHGEGIAQGLSVHVGPLFDV